MEQNTKEKQFTSLIEEYKRVIYKSATCMQRMEIILKISTKM